MNIRQIQTPYNRRLQQQRAQARRAQSLATIALMVTMTLMVGLLIYGEAQVNKAQHLMETQPYNTHQ